MALDLSSYFSALQQPGPNNAPAVQNPYPKGYMTPAAIKAAYDYSQALLKNSEGPVPGTKGGWTVGVQHLVDALIGGQQAGMANQGELASRGYDASKQPQAPGFGVPPAPAATSGDALGDKTAAPASASLYQPQGGSDLDKAASITKTQESGGKYDNVTTTVNPKTGKPQSALGAYGVMDFNVAPWTKEVLGKEMTPQEFLTNPAAQDAVYKAKMGGYISQYGPEGAGRAWLGGPGGVNNPQRSDPLGTKVGDYGNKFAMAFNGQGGSPAQSAIVTALNGRGKAPPTVPGVPAGEQSTPTISPFAVPQRPQYTRDQYEKLIGSPWQSDAQKAEIRNEYMQEHQPIGVPYLGNTVIVNPNNPSQQFLSPTVHWGSIKGPEGMEAPLPQAVLPGANGQPQLQNIRGGQTPGAGGQPGNQPPPPLAPPPPIGIPAPPAATPGQSGAIQPQNSPALALNSPAGASDAANSPVAQAAAAAMPVAPPVAETSNQAITAAQGAVKPPAMVPSAAPPPVNPAAAPMGARVAAALSAAPEQAPGGEKTAQVIPPELKEMADFGQTYNQQKAINSADAAQYTKNLQQYTDLGIRGANAVPTLDIATKMLQDKRYYSGIGADLWEGMGKLKALAGIDKNAAAPMEIFNKILSGNIVTDLKTMLGGLGQIRLAEINLITNSVANKYNTPTANAAVLQMMKREYERTAQVGKIASAYSSGWQLGPNDQWVPRQGPPTSAGLQSQILGYTQRHPLFSDDEVKNIENIFNMSPKTPNAAVPADKTRAELEKAAGIGFSGPAEAAEAPQGQQNPTQPQAPADYERTKTIGNTTYGFKGGQWYPMGK